MKKVCVATVTNAESSMIVGVFTTREKVRETWDDARRRLLLNAKYILESEEHTSTTKMLEEEIQNLSCEDPEKMDNWSQDTPRIKVVELDKWILVTLFSSEELTIAIDFTVIPYCGKENPLLVSDSR